MLKKMLGLGLILFLLPIIIYGAVAPVFQVGKDYEEIAPSTNIPAPPKGKIVVEEFFNYGCPACFRTEPALEKWLANSKPADVIFNRYAMTFEPGWDVLARAYYTAKNLGVESKITPAVFNALHVQGVNLIDPATLKQFFVAHGVSPQDFDSAFNFSPGIDGQVIRGTDLMRTYALIAVPSLVINGKYKTNPRLAGGDSQRLLQIMDYLIVKAREEAKK